MKIWKKEFSDMKWRFFVINLVLISLFFFVEHARGYIINMSPGDMFPLMKKLLPKFINVKSLIHQLELMRTNKMYYIWSQWYAKNFYQIILLSVVIYGFSTFAREVERKTIYFLLSMVKREEVFLGKVCIGAILLIVTILIGGVLPIFSGFSFIMIFELLILNLVVALFLYMIVIYFSIREGDDVKTIIWAVFVFFMLGIPGFFKKASLWNIYRYMMGVDIFAKNTFPLLSFIVILGLFIVMFFINWKTFKLKEF